jgi:hypothetical protein
MIMNGHECVGIWKVISPIGHRLMSKKRQQARKTFAATADVLMEEIAAGKWDHIAPILEHAPVEKWKAVLDEFWLRCPGHAEAEYVEALARSRWNRLR